MKQALHVLCSVALMGLFALSQISELRAQTGLGLRLGQPEDLTLTVDGRLTLESAAFLPVNKSDYRWHTASGQDEPLRMAPGTTISQARLALVTGYKNWAGRIDVNFAGNSVALADTYIRYAFSERGDVTLGYLFDPISIGLNTASRHTSLAMPAPVTFLTPVARHWGITLTQWGGSFWFSGGLYAGGMGGTLAEPNHTSEGYGVAGRFVYLPVYTGDHVLHLGVSASTRSPERTLDPTGAMTLAADAPSAVDRHTFVQSAIPNVQRYEIFGVEVAYRNPKFYARGEYLLTNVGYDPTFGSSNPDDLDRGLFVSPKAYESYHGGYLTIGYMLRGEQRAYNRGAALFRNTADELLPGGNLELMGRLSYLDAQTGGKLLEGLAALNWYPNKLVMLGLNYSYSTISSDATAGGKLRPFVSGGTGLGIHTLQLRAQLVF